MLWAKNKQSGFTIVELLIVVVVIAILAAITIVSYNGIQSRANQSATMQGLAQYAKGVSAYAAQNGLYPAPGANGCIPDTDATGRCSSVGSGVAVCFGMGLGVVNTTLETTLKTLLTAVPAVSPQTGTCGGQPYRGVYVTIAADGKSGMFHSFWKGNITCPSISSINLSSRAQQDDVTLCRYSLPAL